ncbi:hypothetical protein Misp01_57500 [Microtetraspora sp. NBRC 13810]|uniref:PucR family transcriptional regulator n=1 Tax=Microtetraspora sp. NBRC 13810 TaxID=3030990 RepID=UPI0024A00F4E|nr:PucR family transcriptional regulator [Microtetraspora sp. NBRC 13810]GLW10622.1 hypothetical protein Misp01_57500 [Microtetraspora sp. NBRC 13810]
MRIRDLVAVDELRLSVLAGGEHLDREFTAVYVTDLPDPARYLSGGELVLTGLMWRQEPADSERFADAMVACGVAAVGAGQARLGVIPDDLVAACRARGLPLLAVPTEVSFKTVSEVLGARLALDVRDALGRHRRIVAAVAEGTGLAELFALTVRELGVHGMVLSATGEPVTGSLPGAPLRRLAREYLAAPRLPHLVRLPEGVYTLFGVSRSHRAAGWALACAGDLLEKADVGYELAACVALERTRMEEGRRVERRLAEELIGVACAGGEAAELAARLRTCGIDAAEPYVVLSAGAARPAATRGPDPASLGGQIVEELLGHRVVAPAGADGALALVPLREAGALLARAAGSGAGGVPGDGAGGVPGDGAGKVPGDGAGGVARDGAEGLAGLLRDGVATLAAGVPAMRVSIGVSGALEGAAALRGGIEEARHARRLAEAREGGVVTSDEIYTHTLLLATVPDDVRRSFASRLLDPLFDYDRRHSSELVRTLGTFLECAGSWNACAERMHVHVNTVRYRIRRVEDLTGRDLSTMTDRVDFYLALRAT